MVQRFVAGESLSEALPRLVDLSSRGFSTSADVLGEAVHSTDDADIAVRRYLELLDVLHARGLDGNVSLKLTQMGLEVDFDRCRENVGRVLDRAADTGAFVRVDMEDHTRTDATLAIVRDLHRSYPNVGVVLQSCLRRCARDAEMLCRAAISVRLCKGAYDEPEALAYPAKSDVDESYRQLAARLLQSGLHPAFATHDEKLIAFVSEYARSKGISSDQFEFQMLYGVRRDLQERLLRAGYAVRVYVPFGNDWYPYFMRRLAERPANIAFMIGSVIREGFPGRQQRRDREVAALTRSHQTAASAPLSRDDRSPSCDSGEIAEGHEERS